MPGTVFTFLHTDAEVCWISRRHAARSKVQCYVAVLLRNADGTPYGTLCHYDVVPRATPETAFDELRTGRQILEPVLTTGLAHEVLGSCERRFEF